MASLGGERDLGRVARAQVLQARLEQPDEEVGDAVVEVAEGLVRVVARGHGLRVLRLLLAPGLGGLSRGGPAAADAAPLAALAPGPAAAVLDGGCGDVVLVLALVAGAVEDAVEDLGEVLEAAEPGEAGEVGGERARVDGVHPESGDVEAFLSPFLSLSPAPSPPWAVARPATTPRRR